MTLTGKLTDSSSISGIEIEESIDIFAKKENLTSVILFSPLRV
jgi:hypothetical protein